MHLLSENKLTSEESPKNFGNRPISKAYEYFKSRFLETNDKGVKKFSKEEIFNYLKKVTCALIVKIDVDNISSAFMLFESINNRGIPLTPIDLIKNSIIGKLSEKYKENPISINSQWQTIVKNIESYDDQVRFLRHYYHAFQKNERIGIKGYTKATKSNIIKIYSEHIDKDVKFIFDELIEKAKIYNQFVHPEALEKSQYKEKLIDLQRLGIAPAYSLLLFLFTNFKDEDFTNLLNFLENWFIRRHITDYPATNKLDQIFLDLISEINNSYDFENIKLFLQNKDNYQSDEKFKDIKLSI